MGSVLNKYNFFLLHCNNLTVSLRTIKNIAVKDQPKSITEHHATQKKIWVTPDVQIIESNEIRSGNNTSVTESRLGSTTIYGINS